MLRVGLTGGLGSGKSTVGTMLAAHGAHVLEADAIARDLMQPGQAVYASILERFGEKVVRRDRSLDRGELARLAFAEGRVEELNAIVHPAVIAQQAEAATEIGTQDPSAVVVVESALILETQHGGVGGWRSRFDRLILVLASEEEKIERFARRSQASATLTVEQTEALRAEARRRLANQIADDAKIAQSDFILRNSGTLAELQGQVDALWPTLAAEAAGAR